MKKLIVGGGVCLGTILTAVDLSAHCQVPCGIYDDHARFTEMREHVTTIERAMKQINAGDQSINQISRWVLNKEKHAEKIQDIVAQYFLTQRIKPSTPQYHKKLEALHKIIVGAMKCKQGTNLGTIPKLRDAISLFETLYTSK